MVVHMFLTEDVREKILTYDIENSEHTFDRDMFYITNTEKDILHNIIDNIIGVHDEVLIECGFTENEIDTIRHCDYIVAFTNVPNGSMVCG